MLHSFAKETGPPRLYSPSGLVRLAAARCGLPPGTDLADPDAAHALDRLCRSFEAARPEQTAFGKLHAQAVLLHAIARRLRLNQARQPGSDPAGPLPRRPVFIVAPFRTGTTFLHRLLACDPQNRCPLLWEVAYPPPAEPRGPDGAARSGQAADARIAEAAAALRMLHRASPELARLHPMAPDLAEECFGLLETSFLSHSFMFYADLPAYLAWLETRSQGAWRAAYALYAEQLRRLHSASPERRWVLKAPAHLWNLDALLHAFPDAAIVQLHRDPVDAMRSFARLLAAYRAPMCKAVQPQAIAEQACAYTRTMLQRATAARNRAQEEAMAAGGAQAAAGRDRFIDIGFADLLRDPMRCVGAIYALIEARLSPQAEAAMRLWLARHGKDTPHPGFGAVPGATESVLDRRVVQDMFAAYDGFLPPSASA